MHVNIIHVVIILRMKNTFLFLEELIYSVFIVPKWQLNLIFTIRILFRFIDKFPKKIN